MLKSNFKLMLTVLLGLVLLTFTSCEKDSDELGGDIVGLWTITSTKVDIKINNVSMIQYYMKAFGFSEAQAQEMMGGFEEDVTGTMDLKEDGTYTATTDGDSGSGKYIMNASNSKITMDEGTEGEIVYDVTVLTTKRLELSITETEVVDMDDDGQNDTYEMIMTLVLTK